MKNKEKFKEELIELLYKYDLSVLNFIKIVKKDEFWIDGKPNKKLQKEIDKAIEV